MTKMDKIINIAITSVLGLAAAGTVVMSSPALAAVATEKCYGIAKKEMNDCETHTNSCAGSATKDNQPDAFLLVPKGLCNKITGGSLTSKTK